MNADRAAAARVGAFALLGAAVLLALVLWVGRDWRGATTPVQMRFAGSVYGLQVGAPVVLRGVPVGQVAAIGLAAGSDGVPSVPVAARVDPAALAPLLPPDAAAGTAVTGAEVVAALVRRGLVARLQTQSLLTGLLYVELDIDPRPLGAAGDDVPAVTAVPGAPAAAPARAAPSAGVVPEVPTRYGAFAALQQQLQVVDLGQAAQDLAAMAAASRRLLGEPGAEQALARFGAAAAAVQALATQWQRDSARLAQRADGVLGQTQQAVAEVSPAAARAARELAAAGAAVTRAAQAVDADGRPALAALQRAGNELARAAQQLGTLTAADSALAQDTQRALADVSRAARSLRELADLLERHPDALLRGRQETAK